MHVLICSQLGLESHSRPSPISRLDIGMMLIRWFLTQDQALLPNETSGIENRTVIVTTIMVSSSISWSLYLPHFTVNITCVCPSSESFHIPRAPVIHTVEKLTFLNGNEFLHNLHTQRFRICKHCRNSQLHRAVHQSSIFSLCDLSVILLSIQITQMFSRVLNSILNSAVMASWTRRVHHLPFSRTVKVTRTGVLDAVFCFVHLSTVILCVNWNTAWMGHILYTFWRS